VVFGVLNLVFGSVVSYDNHIQPPTPPTVPRDVLLITSDNVCAVKYLH